MKKYAKGLLSALLTLVFLCTLIWPVAAIAAPADLLSAKEPALTGENRSRDFDFGWKFHLGEADGAEAAGYNDSGWKDISLPHDYSIEQDYSRTAQGESGYKPGGIGWYRKTFTLPKSDAGKRILLDFDGVYMNSTTYINGQKLGDNKYGYNPFSFDITNYVKPGQANTVAVRVDNKLPSSRWYSGSGIYRDVKLTVTDPIHIAKDGVYVTTPDLAQNAKDGRTVIATTVNNDTGSAAKVQIRQTITGKDGYNKAVTSVPLSVSPNSGSTFRMEVGVDSPKLWTPDTPNLYNLKTEILVNGKTVDEISTDIGYRWFKVSNTKGLFLNGRPIKIKGVCLHHDQGAIGSRANRTAIERQLQIMKRMGCNAIRTSHNPPSAHLIDLANQYGFMISDEMYDGWHAAKNANIHDFSESFNKEIPKDNELIGAYPGETWAEYSLKSAVKRDRNAPSVYNWDLGNEVEGAAVGVAYDRDCKKLIQWTQEVDDTRIVSTADSLLKYYDKFEVPDHTNMGDMQTKAGGMVGGNYVHGNVMDVIHKNHPDWAFYSSEETSAINSRGVYKHGQDNKNHQLSAYDENAVSWGKTAAEGWYDNITRDFSAGQYVWTGFDYIGEPTPWNSEVSIPRQGFPAPKSSYFGIVDLAGFPKDSYYFYESQWNEKRNTLHILPQWNENVVEKDKNGNVQVVVYSNAKTVELFFTPKNGGPKVSLGKKTFTTKKSDTGEYSYQIYEGPDKSDKEYENLYLSWNVPYADGTISAVGYDANGNVLKDTDGLSSISTTGPAAKLEANVYGGRTSINADGKDLAYIEVTITDAQGRMVPDACNKITVKVNGKPAKLVGVDNGNANDMQSFQDDNRKAFNGKFLAIVQSGGPGVTGPFSVTLSADGLQGTTVTLNAE